jgi:hypothetical protein
VGFGDGSVVVMPFESAQFERLSRES